MHSVYDPFTIGFDRIFKTLNSLDSVDKPKKFPAYDIIKITSSDNLYQESYLIQLAIAGYKKENLKVELDKTTLRVTGTSENVKIPENSEIIYNGISKRTFRNEFILDETLEVTEVELKDGILSIYLDRKLKIPDTKILQIK